MKSFLISIVRMSSFKLSSLFDTSHFLIDFGDLSRACLVLQSTLAKNGILSLCARNGMMRLALQRFVRNYR